jgi:hypothetical protein
MAAFIYDRFGVEVSESTITRTLKAQLLAPGALKPGIPDLGIGAARACAVDLRG